METPKVFLLTQDNWESWKVQIKIALLDRGTYGFIDSNEPELSPQTNRKIKLDYQLRKDRAFTTIYNNLSQEYKTLISHTTDGSLAFKILQEYFEPKS